MNHSDSTLAEDFDWALFPQEATVSPLKRWVLGLEVSSVVVLTWLVYQPLAVVLACLAISFREFRRARVSARAIPDKAAAWISSLFGYAWAAWTLGVAACATFFVLGVINVTVVHDRGMPAGAGTAMLLAPCGFLAALTLTAAGLVMAIRSGLRIWIGEGMNQARTLLLGLLILLFTVFGIGPLLVLLSANIDRNSGPGIGAFISWVGLLAATFAGPIAILIVLDRISRRVLASHPGTYGPKVPSLKKWDV
ncbi:hypothetical protein [Planctomyces sp. SH-PL62]|uniref:hypothetical protein n=1 Tax=Planctomyces sp. SH-PL62 TaxID=1636152 RepID=UPI00078BDD62|nr:hypothetical protein [Planctomyces sp. SH-PL62]AMV40184.1 hypothetical protein VT85_22320 [Planctomyces sp. SH-PL62]